MKLPPEIDPSDNEAVSAYVESMVRLTKQATDNSIGAVGGLKILTGAAEKAAVLLKEEESLAAKASDNAVPNLQANDKMRQMTNLHPNYDCSEIADDLYRAAGNKGEILKITPIQKYGDLNVIENGKTTAFDYHEVYSDGKYVFDPRYTNNPILKDDYIKMLNDLNGGKINIEILK